MKLIFATESEELQSYYEELSRNSPLKDHMSAIRFKKTDEYSTLDVIEWSYRQITSEIEFGLNLTEAEYLSAEFFNNCTESGKLRKSKFCKNVQIEKSYQFVIQLTLDKKPDIPHVRTNFFSFSSQSHNI